ncbi:Synaptobrevin [Penicillium lagena]|uniref:Synaptobrevin n=1 Tax=Penicillium lagena TaxID=94218 RepID=UPI002542333A|nr:Synaptobrevin [Penicillium lagena]XP_057058602.1 Synaptobrevin [Penicillium riverlandense]KAJ5618818.1 Synaptobrevin [Penicillium lagena]KAJ5833923.1 Synaptobrevin [Penicillium riverlandense]
MKIFYMGVLRNDTKPALQLCGEKELSSFSRFTRQNYEEFLMLFCRTVAERTNPGQRQDVEEKSYTFHAYGRTEGVAGVIVTDGEYPALVAHQLLSKILDEFLIKNPRTAFSDPNLRENACSFPQLKEYIIKYQDPSQADSIMKIQQELDETKIVLHKTIESVLERGEKIDSLVAKSDGLSAQSKMFYTQAKKQNSCCVVM